MILGEKMENPLERLPRLTDTELKLLVRVMNLNEDADLVSLIEVIKDLSEKSKLELIQALAAVTAKRIKFAELSLFAQVSLVYLCEISGNHDTVTVAGTSESAYEIAERLISIGAITVSPRSMLDVYGLLFDVKVDFTEEQIQQINNNSYFINNFMEEELIRLYKQFLYRDMLKTFRFILQERNLDLYVTQDASIRFKKLFDKINYRQILHLCNRVVIDYADRVNTGKLSARYAETVVLEAVCRYYTRAVTNQWTIYEADVMYLQEETLFFIERVLGFSTDILGDIPTQENFADWRINKKVEFSKWQPLRLF